MAVEVRLGNTSPVQLIQVEPDDPRLEEQGVELPEDAVGPAVVREAHPLAEDITPRGEEGPDGLVTIYRFPDSFGPREILHVVAFEWRKSHSDDPPEWVAVHPLIDEGAVIEEHDEALESLLASEFSLGEHVCEAGWPSGWTAGNAHLLRDYVEASS